MKIIGVLSDFVECDKHTKLGTPYYQVRGLYIKSLQKYAKDAVIFIIPYIRNKIDEYIKICDGVLLVGGNDIDPDFYKEEKMFDNVGGNTTRYKFEIDFVKKYIKTNKPLLGICAGLQVINVALHGNLYQDIAQQMAGKTEHNQSANFNIPVHKVNIVDNTLLQNIIQKKCITTNSIHHQCVKKLGKNLIVSAIADDGIIEGIELKKHKFCIGVQWHPEWNSNKYDKHIFKSFCQSL